MGTSRKKIHKRKKIRKKIRKKRQEDTFNDPVSTPYGKANSSLRPDSFLKSLVILKTFALAALVQKFVRMTSDFKKLLTGPGKNYILPLYTGTYLHNNRFSSSNNTQNTYLVYHLVHLQEINGNKLGKYRVEINCASIGTFSSLLGRKRRRHREDLSCLCRYPTLFAMD